MAVDFTQTEFDKLCDYFDQFEFQCGPWFPSLEEIKEKIEPNIDENIYFAIWILQTSRAPETDKVKTARRYLMRLVNDNIVVREPRQKYKRVIDGVEWLVKSDGTPYRKSNQRKSSSQKPENR